MSNLTTLEKKDTRSGFGDGLYELGLNNEDVVGLCADLTGSLKMNKFQDEFPERFFQVGIAEANMMGLAAGLATAGKIPFTGTFANFSTGRVYDQIRQSIAYSQKNVKICASHAGLTLGEDGATHQILEDLGMMKMLPGMVVINPCDYNQTKAATIAIAEHYGPVYLRFGRPKWPIFTASDQKFEIGKADLMREGSDVTIVATGHMVWQAMQAAEQLASEGISAEILNMHTIKPLDEESLLDSVYKTKCVVTAEEHQINGGLGESVCQALSRRNPSPVELVAVQDQFGESGKPEELLDKYGLGIGDVAEAVRRVLKRNDVIEKLLIVYNPKAGRKSHEKILDEIKKELPSGITADFINIKEFEQFDNVYSFDAVAAVGGDGTVNTVAGKLQYGSVPLAIIPAGSGDGLARHFNIPKKVKSALQIIKDNHQLSVDTGDISGQFFINVAGTGFEAEVAHQFGHHSGRGLLGYIKTIMVIFKNHKEHEAELLINNEKQIVKYFSLTIANGSQWGNNFRIASVASIKDGLLDIAVMRKPKLLQIPKLVRSLLAKDAKDHHLMEFFKAEEVTVKGAHHIWHIDGEPIHLEHSHRVTCLPGSLKIIVPK